VKILVVLLSTCLALPAGARTARHVLIVANNNDPSGKLDPLRYADDDGARYSELFSSTGARVELLCTMDTETQRLFPELVGQTRPPTRARLRSSLSRIFDAIRQDKTEGMQTEFIFVFTGHGRMSEGSGQLLLTDGPLARKDFLTEVIDASPADFNHIIIDACHAYYLVMPRGEWHDDRGGAAATDALRAYLRSPNELSRRPTTGVILSTAGAAEVHEWERYRSGVFSHELRSGLLGPADLNADGRISYGELESFLAAANAGVTNPKARIQIFVLAPEQNLDHPLLELGPGLEHVLRFPKTAAGHFEVEDARGLAYAEWNKAPDQQAYLALLYPPVKASPTYFVRRRDRELKVSLVPPGDGRQEISFDEGSLVPRDSSARGSVAEAFRTQLFSVPFGSAFARGFMARREGERIAEVQRAAYPQASRSHFISAAYLISDALMESDDIAQGALLSYRFSPWNHFHLTARMDYRHTSGGKEGNAHTLDDIGLLLGGGAHWQIINRLCIFVDGLAGNHFIAYTKKSPSAADKDKTSWDELAPAVGFAAGLRVDIFGPVFMQASGGLDFVFSSVEGEENSYLVPAGTFEIGAAF